MSERLLEAVEHLTEQVALLNERITVSVQQARRTRQLTWLATFFTAVSLIGVSVTAYLYIKVDEATATNKNAAVISCQNANESRAANRVLWNFVVDLSLNSNDDPPTMEEQRFLQEARDWINTIYMERDCSNLTKKYVIPDPPTIFPTDR